MGIKKSLLMASFVLVSMAPALSNTQAEFNNIRNNIVNVMTTNTYVSASGKVSFNNQNKIKEAFSKVKSFYKKHPEYKSQLVEALAEALICISMSQNHTIDYNEAYPFLKPFFDRMAVDLLESM